MKTYIVRLFFKNATHIGSARPSIGIEGTDKMIIHSDTLWAALCNNWAVVGRIGGIGFDEFLDSFKNAEPPLFKISSAFPFTNKGSCFWLPKPLTIPFDFSAFQPSEEKKSMQKQYSKDIKRTQFLKLSAFKKWALFSEGVVSNISKFDNSNIVDTLRPHNSLDRISQASEIYHSGLTYFEKEGVGLYFLLQCDEKIKDIIVELLEIIKDTSGIGGNRSNGLGAIDNIGEVKESEIIDQDWGCVEENSDPNAYCLLSLYHPVDTEPYLETVAYDMVLRKGWTGSLSVGQQVKRQTVWMFGEGSVFKTKPKGHLVDVTPTTVNYPHKVYRYGCAFSVPVKINMEDYK